MAVVNVYQRHSKKCLKRKEDKAGQQKRCRCRFRLRGGKNGKRSAKTSTLEIATEAARKLEQELEFEALGIEAPKKPDHITIEAAVKLHLDRRTQRRVVQQCAGDIVKPDALAVVVKPFGRFRGVTFPPPTARVPTSSSLQVRLTSARDEYHSRMKLLTPKECFHNLARSGSPRSA
jgi:hypothetical protein